MRYYWVEWGGAWGLWREYDNQFKRCVFRISPDKGMWRVDRVDGVEKDDRKYIVRYNDVERAKARAAIEARFPDEGETK